MCEGRHQIKVCVTGANGFLGTQIVSQCLQRGYRVCATVRDDQNQRKTQHLLQLDGASGNVEVFSAVMLPESSSGFKEAIAGCSAVFHTASPGTRAPMSKKDVHAAVFGTLSVLRASKAAGVKTVVMTSGVCAASPEGATIISEKDWSEPKQQMQDNMYHASKTLAEYAAWQYMKEKPGFRLVTILPSSIVGPSTRNEYKGCLMNMLRHGPPGGICPDESLCLVDVRDCASHHIAAMEQESVNGRIFSTAASWHWNDLCDIMKEMNPEMPTPRKCRNPTVQLFLDQTRQNDLGVHIREIPDILRDVSRDFKTIRFSQVLTSEKANDDKPPLEPLWTYFNHSEEYESFMDYSYSFRGVCSSRGEGEKEDDYSKTLRYDVSPSSPGCEGEKEGDNSKVHSTMRRRVSMDRKSKRDSSRTTCPSDSDEESGSIELGCISIWLL